MKKLLIFLGVLFSSVFITSNVNAEYYTDGTVTYDYNFLKVLISEQYNINLDDYNYFVSRTVVYDANYSHITPQIQFMFWNGSEPRIDRIADDDTLYVLSETYDSVYYGSIVLKNNDNYSVSVYSGTGGKNYYENGFPVVLKRFTKFQGDDLYYSALASSVKGFNKLTFNDKIYDLDNLLSDKVVSDDDIKNPNFYDYPKQNGFSDKLYSIDYTISKEAYNRNTKIKHEIAYDINHDKYSSDKISKYLYLESFSFYGLVNDNGLYHYEKLDNKSGSYVDDYVEKYENNKYYLDINSFNLDFTKYEKIIVRTQFFTDENLNNFTTKSNNENIHAEDVFYNTVFGANYLNIFFNTEECLYLDISTDLEAYNSKFYAWGYDKTDTYKQPYILYFDTSTSSFLSETGFYGIYYANHLGYDYLNEFRDFEIGKNSKKAISVTRDLSQYSDVNFTYNLILDYRNLYFSYNNTKIHIDKIFIDSNGNWYQDDGIPAYNTNISSFDYMKEVVSNTIQRYSKFMLKIKEALETFYNGLPSGIKTGTYLVFIFLLAIGSAMLIL